MTATLALTALILFGQSRATGRAPSLSTPSQAWAYANASVEEWNEALKAGKLPRNRIRPDKEMYRRAGLLCPSFEPDSVSGEELYWLAKLCESGSEFPEALAAAERYLALPDGKHRPDAHLVLATAQVGIARKWDSAWPTFRAILQEDPIESDAEVSIRVAIAEVAEKNEGLALQWSQERYALLLERATNPRPGLTPVSYTWVEMAGADLVHRYFLRGQSDKGTELVAELNRLRDAHPKDVLGWGNDFLNWANMEFKPAPSIPVLKTLGRGASSDIIQKGRVEVVHFFFLRCSPCMTDLRYLTEFQKRYKSKVLVANVTTYNAALQPDTPPHTTVESALDKTRKKKSPGLTMTVAPERTLQDYRITSYPVIAVIDKAGRLRYAGFPDGFDEGEDLDRLVKRLVDEPSPN